MTLVASFGTDSNAGIPGVRPQSRIPIQRVERLDNLELISFTDKHGRENQPRRWNFRAWTYQERVLSTRMLIITSQKAKFDCNCYHWVEDFSGEEEPLAHRHGNDMRITDASFRGSFTLRILHHTNRQLGRILDPAFVSTDYRLAVEEYTSRDISFESDILNAFTGIMNIYRTHGNLEFSYGLPTKHFMQFLTWDSAGLYERREEFPSWSWTGWRGTIKYRLLSNPKTENASHQDSVQLNEADSLFPLILNVYSLTVSQLPAIAI